MFAQDSTAQAPAAGAEAASASTSAAATTGDPAKGRELFNSLCAACHNLDNNSVGPPLRGITDTRSTEFLHGWIKNNQQMIASGDPTALEVAELRPTDMSVFPQLTDADIDNILAYVSQPKAEPKAQAGGDTAGSGASGGGGVST
ncbi:MAG TPA: cytochrome c, partial [Salinimicrobium sp.]|nr:cytochrome c [Salinimicrobium sp.]